eukprot:scaffold27365_cov118-Isochrysis_galbana.AAC.6
MSAGHTRRWATPVRNLSGQARPAAASRGACTLALDTVSCCDDDGAWGVGRAAAGWRDRHADHRRLGCAR